MVSMNMMKAGPTSCALGPNAVDKVDGDHLCIPTFSSATIYFPKTLPGVTGTGSTALLPSIVLVGGWGCGEQVLAAWAPFLASHGIVAMTIGTPKPWSDTPPTRAQALIDASLALQEENGRSNSPLYNRLDTNARAIMGYSLGGGGAQLAAMSDPTLKCSVAICPSDGKDFGTVFPDDLSNTVPILILAGEKDKEADPQTQAWEHYRKTTAPKLIMEVKDGDHNSCNGPSGANTSDFEQGAEPCALINCIFAHICACGPCPMGSFNGSSGHARNEAPRGAIGGIVLAWLQLFLLGDESARSMLKAQPDIANRFESQKINRN
mmetsp:Transcript_21650/g.31607  ORF Transcript_21650/g.31607 Transcript_21650/m.31607 type:complete len:321 (+) Transcript_21650:165-1127(+)|eukprot:CAMPEP_0197246836 /NCGR_PEP_ID=MMETSP1429-20130617/23497_1 /TAXON_ID=49237 /ORGANISM="Chaetoceros  sp., Strain UNC1202" /LENGTH=320 /DNA_ID=CAMNT_0042707603 /DNA_START=83 /DNA_END=1045 /DNA_ORIENTATION=-